MRDPGIDWEVFDQLEAEAAEDHTIVVVPASEFSAVDEPGADALIGTTEQALIPEGADVMVYGDGGAGKTTLILDCACHLASGDDWIGLPVPAPRIVLLIEDEGPRPLFRQKLRRKLAGWEGSEIGDRLEVLEEPWAGFTLADEPHRQGLANHIRDNEVDVVVVGPVTVAGMDEVGTIQDTRAFQALLDDVRRRAGRRITFILIHHESKSGKVSGAWEGTGDTLLHVTSLGPGKTRLHIQKARWAPEHHRTTLNLVWAPNEGNTVEEKEELDLAAVAEMIVEYVSTHPGTGWTKVEEATPGVARQRRRDIRDQILKGGQIVNVAKIGGVETILDHIPERVPAHLYRVDDPTISHLRPNPGAGAAQAAPPGGDVASAAAHSVLRPAPRLKAAQGEAQQQVPPKNLFTEENTETLETP